MDNLPIVALVITFAPIILMGVAILVAGEW